MPDATTKKQRLVRLDRVEKYLEDGWMKVRDIKENERILGVKAYSNDLVLMEK